MHHICFMDHITSYGSSHDHESMSLALKVNIIRRPDDQLEINISDGSTEWAPATQSSRSDHSERETTIVAQSQLDTVSR